MVKAPKHSGIYAATVYNDASRKITLAFKHGARLGLARMMAMQMAARLPHKDGDLAPLLVPVPLHRWRLWRRGYNQAAVLGRELERLGKGSLVVDALMRTRKTPSLGGLGRKQRAKALSGAIEINPKTQERIRGRDIILVDDVVTSGATTDACTRALLSGGAASVRISCFARVLDAVGQLPAVGVGPESETPEA